MGNKKNRNPEKKEKKRIEKQEQNFFNKQSNIANPIELTKEIFDKGLKHADNTRYDDAIDSFTAVIELFSRFIGSDLGNTKNYASAYFNRGLAYYDKGEYDKAIKDYDEAIRLNPNDKDAYNNRGNTYAKKGEHDKVVFDYNKSTVCDDKLKTFSKIDFFNIKYIKKMQDRGMLPNFDKSFTKEIIVDENYIDSLMNIDMEVFFEDVNINKALLKMEKFDKQNISQLNEEDISKFIVKILQVNERYYFARKTNDIPSASSFYRVRKLNNKIFKNKNKISSEKVRSLLRNKQEFWACPKNLITEYGRVNKPNESVLYTTIGYSFTPMYETNITKDDIFLFIKYKSRKSIKAGITAEYKETDANKFKKILEIYNDFFIEQFRKEVSTNKEYILTNVIKAKFFRNTNVLVYPSIKKETSINVAFSGEKAQAYLALDTVLLCSHVTLEPDLGLSIRGIIDFSKNKDIVLFNKPDYEEFERIITEFQK